MKENEVKFN